MGYFVEDMDDAKAISRTTSALIKPKPTGGARWAGAGGAADKIIVGLGN